MYTHKIIGTTNGVQTQAHEEHRSQAASDDGLIDKADHLARYDFEEASYFVDDKLWYYVHRSYFLLKNN